MTLFSQKWTSHCLKLLFWPKAELSSKAQLEKRTQFEPNHLAWCSKGNGHVWETDKIVDQNSTWMENRRTSQKSTGGQSERERVRVRERARERERECVCAHKWACLSKWARLPYTPSVALQPATSVSLGNTEILGPPWHTYLESAF